MATATATIVFTDVERSTEVRARIGEAVADRLFLDHERLLVSIVERRGGRVLKKAGDGVMAAFESASDAVIAATDMQRAVTRQNGDIRIRIGIAAGDVSWEEGDCFGLPVAIAARLESAAEGGQILVSQVVRWLAGDRAGAAFEPVGALELKGIPEPIDAFCVPWRASGDEDQFERVPLPPAMSGTSGGGFVGRVSEWHALDEAWQQALTGSRRVMLLGGEPGAGKTRLAFEFARRCHDDGAAVLFGGCDAQLLLPYQPWVQAIDHLLRTLPPDQLDEALLNSLGVLHPLLPRLGRPSTPSAPTPAFVDTDAERYRLFSAVDALFAEASARWPVVLVLDDIHWGGAQTLALLTYIARSTSPGPALVIATFRDVADEVTGPLTTMLADLRRVEHVGRVRVEGLDEERVAELFQQATGHPLGDELREVAADVTRRSRGNAFFAGELWRHLTSSGAIARVGDRWDVRASLEVAGIPESVREVVAERLERLPFPVRKLAELVAVAGTRVDLAVVRTAADMPEAEVTAGLDALVSAGLLEALTKPRLTYQFSHAIVRDTVDAGIPAGAQAQLHLRVAEAIEALHEGDRRPVFAELAQHYNAAAPLGVAGKAVYYARRAAEHALQAVASEEAVALLQSALEHTLPGSLARAELLVTLGDAEHKLGNFGRAVDVATEAFDLAFAAGDAKTAGEAAICVESALQTPGLPGHPAVEMLGKAIALTGDDGTSMRARLEAAYAEALHLSGRGAEGRVHLRSALDLARRSDDGALIVALESAVIMTDDPHECLAYGNELEEVAKRNGDVWGQLYATVNHLRAYVMLGELDNAAVVLARHGPLAQEFRVSLAGLQTCVFEHILALAAGRFDDAEDAAERAFEVAAPTQPAAAGVYGMQMFAVRREQGRLAEVAPVLEAVARQDSGGAAWKPGLAMLHAEVGMLDDARRHFDELAAGDFKGVPHDAVWPASVSFLADACLALEDKAAAEKLYELMSPLQGFALQVAMTTCLGPADRLLGGLAELIGRPDDADRHFAAALAISDRAQSPVWRARALHDWGRVLARRGDVRSAELFAEAGEIAERCGMTILAESARALSRPKLSVVESSATPDVIARPLGLSGREVDVLRLVAQGRSNREIGEALTISSNTAANHVRSILQKTGCANRAEAAAFAAQNDLLT
ncbi:MAG TPA: AAA family ATPase [Acidimicrobiales bacterium]|nr:AAA family ATPase [Acidimicrobiales bacterium]